MLISFHYLTSSLSNPHFFCQNTGSRYKPILLCCKDERLEKKSPNPSIETVSVVFCMKQRSLPCISESIETFPEMELLHQLITLVKQITIPFLNPGSTAMHTQCLCCLFTRPIYTCTDEKRQH